MEQLRLAVHKRAANHKADIAATMEDRDFISIDLPLTIPSE